MFLVKISLSMVMIPFCIFQKILEVEEELISLFVDTLLYRVTSYYFN